MAQNVSDCRDEFVGGKLCFTIPIQKVVVVMKQSASELKKTALNGNVTCVDK